ncbi:hypothetical protein [Hyalangium rubrum]|uniref:Lipoprotein n=1 Tax=Hyalangium rubrum TaxID=3103134 RepID=A0ABU5HK80_9BACT|nr:hypothetical protein [Hyalangium sp. s54d21]MDY7233232.1 hypothetical protein [Hyalangium sp. s54d21]
MRIPCSRAPQRTHVIGTLLCVLAFVGCGSLDEDSAAPEQGTPGESKAPVIQSLEGTATLPGGSYSYSASNTGSAYQNTVNQVVTLTAGQTITVATCGLPGATFTGDTFLRLYGPLIQLVFNDDACGGAGSSLSFTSTGGGTYEIHGGCYGNSSCTATVVWQIASNPPTTGGSYTFSASNTNDAQQNTVNQYVALSPGQTLAVNTCVGATGDTYLRLYGPSATQIAFNDNSCFNGEGSRLSYRTINSGTFQIRAGCNSNSSCSGTVTWTIE